MRSILLFSTISFLLPASALAATSDRADAPDSVCIQVIQHAVSPQGSCEAFPTPCDVPRGWRNVRSCDNIKPRDFGSSVEAVLQRRLSRRNWNKRKAEAAEGKTKRVSRPQYRAGRGRLTRASTSRRLHEGTQTSHFSRNRRTRNTPQFGNRQAYNLYRNTSLSRGGFQQDELTNKEKFQMRVKQGRRRPGIISSAQDAGVREGYFSNESFLQTRNQFYNQSSVGSDRVWKSARMTRRKPKRKRRTISDIQLRQTFRGSSTGNIDGALLDLDD